MNKLFGHEYCQGYTAALQDVLNVIDQIQPDLKLHKRRQSSKTYKAIINCMLDNRILLREHPNAFIRCNDKVDGGFEPFIEGSGVTRTKESQVCNTGG